MPRLAYLIIILGAYVVCAACADTSLQNKKDAGLAADLTGDVWAAYDLAVDRRGDLQILPDTSDPSALSAWKEELGSTEVPLRSIWGTSPTDLFAVGKDGIVWRRNINGWGKIVQDVASELFAVWGSGWHLYAVGRHSNTWWSGNVGAVIFYDRGQKYWILEYSDTATASLRAIWGLSYDDFWVAGEDGLIAHKLSGNFSSPEVKPTSVNLNSIWGTDKTVFIVGDEGEILQNKKVGPFFDLEQMEPMKSGTGDNLYGVWGTGENNVYVVGANGAILRFDGQRWRKMNSGSSEYYYGIWGSGPDDIYVVGTAIFETDKSILHWDGASWKKLPPPTISQFNAVYGFSSRDVFVAGNYNILRLK